MIRKLTPVGDGHGLVIDQAILDLLKITPDTELEIETDGTSLTITPIQPKRRPAPPEHVPFPQPDRRRPEPPKPPPRKPRAGFPKKQPW